MLEKPQTPPGSTLRAVPDCTSLPTPPVSQICRLSPVIHSVTLGPRRSTAWSQGKTQPASAGAGLTGSRLIPVLRSSNSVTPGK